jgi:lysozyme
MAGKSKRNLGWKIILYVTLTAVTVMLGFVVYEWVLEQRAKYIRYTAFGIDIPTNYSIHGIDVSRYQQIIDWDNVKQMKVENVQIDFAFIKATEGVNNEDPYFTRNWKRAKEAGMARGAYHFFIATRSGKTQAENFIKRVQIEPGDLPPVLDVEETYGVAPHKLRQRVLEWMQTVEEYYKVKPILYTNVDFYQFYLKDQFDCYPLWVAHYLQKERPRIYRDWQFWQHNEAGRVNGIAAYVDFNVFNGGLY